MHWTKFEKGMPGFIKHKGRRIPEDILNSAYGKEKGNKLDERHGKEDAKIAKRAFSGLKDHPVKWERV